MTSTMFISPWQSYDTLVLRNESVNRHKHLFRVGVGYKGLKKDGSILKDNSVKAVYFENVWYLFVLTTGGLTVRAILETMDDHNAESFISLSSPQMGQYGGNSYESILLSPAKKNRKRREIIK